MLLTLADDQFLYTPVLITAMKICVREVYFLVDMHECVSTRGITTSQASKMLDVAHLPSGRYLRTVKGIFFSRSSMIAICSTKLG